MTSYERHPSKTLDTQIENQDPRMKPKYAVVFICIVALVIIEKESNIISRYENDLYSRPLLFILRLESTTPSVLFNRTVKA